MLIVVGNYLLHVGRYINRKPIETKTSMIVELVVHIIGVTPWVSIKYTWGIRAKYTNKYFYQAVAILNS